MNFEIDEKINELKKKNSLYKITQYLRLQFFLNMIMSVLISMTDINKGSCSVLIPVTFAFLVIVEAIVHDNRDDNRFKIVFIPIILRSVLVGLLFCFSGRNIDIFMMSFYFFFVSFIFTVLAQFTNIFYIEKGKRTKDYVLSLGLSAAALILLSIIFNKRFNVIFWVISIGYYFYLILKIRNIMDKSKFYEKEDLILIINSCCGIL